MGFWNGDLALPDTLNHGIRLLALMLPCFIPQSNKLSNLIRAVHRTNCTIDDGFSDRLSGGNRAEVSRIVRATVKESLRR